MKRFIFIVALLLIGLAVIQRYGNDISLFSNVNDAIRSIIPQNTATPSAAPYRLEEKKNTTITDHEKKVVEVINDSLPSVVTVGIKATARQQDQFEIDPLNPFQPFRRVPGEEKTIEQNIGSGFIISADGLIITNRHVVDITDATYSVLTNDGKEYSVEKIYRDPLNDLAIIKINANNLRPLPIGDSTKLQLGQTAIAIGTPYGEFKNTVTTGVISGIGRGITTGSPFEGYVEKLDNVIQTDAAINPGNSGGPLLNTSGEIIGVNTAVSAEGQNLGFAIPSNVVRELVDNFNKRGGSFERPYIGVRYKMIDKQAAILNEVVEGAYVVEILDGSPANTAGIQEEDIIVEFDGKKVDGADEQGLAKLILEKNIGDTVSVRVWRNGEVLERSMKLEAAK